MLFTDELSLSLGLCLGLVVDGVSDDSGVHEGEGRYQPLGHAGREGRGAGRGHRGCQGEASQETQDEVCPQPHHDQGSTGDKFYLLRVYIDGWII